MLRVFLCERVGIFRKVEELIRARVTDFGSSTGRPNKLKTIILCLGLNNSNS